MELGIPIDFFDHTVEVGQRVPVVELREPVGSDNTIYLLLSFLEDFRVFCHGKCEHCENIGRLK